MLMFSIQTNVVIPHFIMPVDIKLASKPWRYLLKLAPILMLEMMLEILHSLAPLLQTSMKLENCCSLMELKCIIVEFMEIHLYLSVFIAIAMSFFECFFLREAATSI